MTSRRPYIPDHIRKQVEAEAQYRCGYCLTDQRFTAKKLHLEHIVPIAAGGSSEVENLWLACDLCNSYKGVQIHAIDPFTTETTALFNPRQQIWSEHFSWNEQGTHIVGLTPVGRATVIALRVNHPFQVEARQWWVQAGWHPPI